MLSSKKTAVALAALFAPPFAPTTLTAEEAHTVEAHSVGEHTSSATTDLSKKPKTKLKISPNETVIYVGNLHCKHCAKKISGKLYTVKGVVKVRTDLKADVVVVTPQNNKKLDPLALWKAAKDSKFPALKLEGPSGRYVADPKTQAATLVPEKKATPQS